MKRIKKFAALMLMVSFAMNVQAQFGGSGSGTASDPYLITNEDELFDVRNDLSAHYKLMADLDLTEWIAEESPKDGWNPIGNATTPFRGVFDGNYHTIKGLYINRPNINNIGLFGYIYEATIKNTALINPTIKGNNYVGTFVGLIRLVNENDGYNPTNCKNYVNNNVVIGGKVTGNNNVGGIIGGNSWVDNYFTHGRCYVQGNFSSISVEGIDNVGGIIGYDCCKNYYYAPFGRYYGVYSIIDNNNYIGNIVSTGEGVGGIIGGVSLLKTYSSDPGLPIFERNIAGGNIIGKKNTNGLVGSEMPYSSFCNNVCYADTVACGESVPYRISALSYENNYSILSTVLVYNGTVLEVEDNNYNGVSYGARSLRRKTTYQGMGFDFDNQWAISELKSYPYNIKQSTPPELTSFTLGDASVVKGTANGSGKLYVFVGDKMYEGTVTDGQWQMSLGYVDAGKRVTVSVQTGNLMPSPMLVVQKGDAAELPTGEVEGVYLPRNISTFCSNKSLDFSQTKGLTAYIAAGYNKGTVMLMRAKYVPAGEGVILMGDPGSYNVYTTSTKVYYSNMLKGVLEPTMIEPTDGDKTNFILTNGSTGIGFYAVSNTGELAAGKAYLQLPTDAFIQSGKAINFVFDDQTTGIFNVEASNENDSYYTLDGVRLSQRPTEKGIYIHKGKKIIITK